ncbi:MAG: radical SAM/SPASM domain-containing protein [Bacteroidota bacterium]|jgi:radical SAM protein with 4Fe4S-binding SPASM domain|nr:SPASM domain-containing protein [Sphingobacteriales bacterium]
MNRSLTDGINVLSKLNGKRLLNVLKLFTSYYLSKSTGKVVHWGKPLSMEIEPTTSCNLRCPQCPSGLREFSRNTGMLNLDLYKKIIDEIHEELVWLILYFQGEPFLNKQFLEFVSYASARNIYTATSSNAHYFTDEIAKASVESGLDRLIISVDGTTQDIYGKYRVGGKLDKVIEGTERLLYWKNKLNKTTPHIIWQFIAFKHNEHQIPEIKALAKKIGVDELGIKTAQIYDYQNSADFIPENKDLSRYEKLPDGSYRIKNKLLNQCWRMWRGSVITWDGLVVPCCFDKDATHRFGDVSTDTFQQVWSGDKYNLFRQAILKSRKEIDICTNCTEGTKVWN